MSPLPDAFCHHPELFGKITDPLTSFFRTFDVQSVFADKPELHWVLELLHSDELREQTRADILGDKSGTDLWVFAYGSLMWDPAFQFAEVRRACLPGFSRQFLLKDIYGGRGTPELPGMMAALDHGGNCEGLAFRIDAQAIDIETEILWRREMIGPGYVPTFVDVQVGEDTRSALTFVADHDAESISLDLSREEQVRYIASGSGFLGTSKEYLANIVSQFSALGIDDSDCSALLREVEHYSNTNEATANGQQ